MSMVARVHNGEALFWMRPEERENHEYLVRQLRSTCLQTIKLVASTQTIEDSHWERVFDAIQQQTVQSLQITFPDLLPPRVFSLLMRAMPDALVLRGIQHPTPMLRHLLKLSKLNVGIQPMWDDETSIRTCEELQHVDADTITFTYFKFTGDSFRTIAEHNYIGYHHCKFDRAGTKAFEEHYQKGGATRLTIMGGLVFDKSVSEVFKNVLGPQSTVLVLDLNFQFGDTRLIEALTSAMRHNRSVQTLTIRGANHFDNRAYMMQELQFVTRGFEIWKFLESLKHHTRLLHFESDVPGATSIVQPFVNRNKSLRQWVMRPTDMPLSTWPSIIHATKPCTMHPDIVFQALMNLNEYVA